jgi:hypothetical protein
MKRSIVIALGIFFTVAAPSAVVQIQVHTLG